ncbi:MAG: type VII secretion protein EccB, partial [Ornithinibacter sp.]
MATKKDLVEAQSFSRRRLTTAFVSGAPGGREVEPHRPLRAVAGGLALTVVLILGSMAFGWLRSSLPQGWENNRLVIAQDSGARYVSVKSVLHPVVNTTSARLLIPAADFKVLSVPDSELESIRRGPTLGILGAPDSLTPADRLVSTGWVSCLGAGEQVSTAIGPSRAATPVERAAVVVRSAGTTFVVSDGRRHRVDDRDISAVTIALRLDGRPALAAPAAWLNLFPEGSALGPLSIDDLGSALPGLPAGASVGSVLALKGDQDGRRYLVLPDGTLESLSPVALEMYRLGSGSSVREVPVQAAQIRQLEVRPQSFSPKDWPLDLPTAVTESPCATL